MAMLQDAQAAPHADVCPQQSAATELGEGKLPKGNLIGWARRQLLAGKFVARHGWRLEAEPRRLWVMLETYGYTEILSTRFEHQTTLAKFSRLNWQDLNGSDWYVVDQLELVR